MPPPDLALRSRRVVTPEGVKPAAILIRNGVIVDVAPFEAPPPGAPLLDCGQAVLLPGLVDTHVHVNEPGRSDWEGFETATRAAAAGGITTIIDMPLNSVPATTSVPALRAKLAAAEGKCHVDVGFWGGVVSGNAGELGELVAAGVRGFKCFLVPSGVDEFPHVTEADLRQALPRLAGLGVPLLVHAELPGPIDAALRDRAREVVAGVSGARRGGGSLPRRADAASGRRLRFRRASRLPRPGADPRAYATYLRSRPPEAETAAVTLLLRLCREYGVPAHVVHLSAAEALPLLLEARAEGLPLSVETCPHYLHFAAEDIPDGATQFKCAPPIRGRANREALWQSLERGDIDLVASDHSPCPPALKRRDGDFLRAWGGISSLQLGLSVVWSVARARGQPFERLAEWLSRAPARLAGLEGRKGAIAPGYDADLVAWHPEAEFTVDPATLQHRHKLTPYAGVRLAGVVDATFLRGRLIYRRGSVLGPPVGQLLLEH
ncbi:MAG: amidohydrolase family protein [Gemmatimonadetes bacterium]|nr:amidohydrolase family protein [Gemmatimonadota bacterium]